MKGRATTRAVEFLVYALRPGSGEEFHRIMHEISVPLHRRCGLDVVAYGQSVHDRDAYHLIRAAGDFENMEVAFADFYGSEAWRLGPREAIIARIATSLRTVVSMDAETVESLRRQGE